MIQLFSVYSQYCITITLSNLEHFCVTSKRNLMPPNFFLPHLLAATDINIELDGAKIIALR